MNLVHLLILVQHLRQFVQKQLVYLLTRYRLVLADHVQDQIPVVTIIETPISDMLGFFTRCRRYLSCYDQIGMAIISVVRSTESAQKHLLAQKHIDFRTTMCKLTIKP